MNHIEIEAIILLFLCGITIAILKLSNPFAEQDTLHHLECYASLIEISITLIFICFTIHLRFLGKQVWDSLKSM